MRIHLPSPALAFPGEEDEDEEEIEIANSVANARPGKWKGSHLRIVTLEVASLPALEREGSLANAHFLFFEDDYGRWKEAHSISSMLYLRLPL